MKINFKNKLFTEEQLKNDIAFKKIENPIFAEGPGLGKAKIVYAFTSEKEFLKWATKTPQAKAIAAAAKELSRARKEQGKNETYLKEWQKTKTERVESDLKKLSKVTGLKYGSKELFLRATAKAPSTEGPVFDPAWFFTGAGFTGNSLAAVLPLPNLNWWPGMNNTISSVRVLGICVLYSNTWFRGASRWMVGVPYMENSNLGSIGFNNITSSAYVYLY